MRGLGYLIQGSRGTMGRPAFKEDTVTRHTLKPLALALALTLPARASGPEEASAATKDVTQERAIAAVKRLGGKFTTDARGMLVAVDLSDKLFADDDLAPLAGLATLRGLDLGETHVTDEGLRHLAGLTALERLSLRDNVAISAAGLAHLKRLTRLRELNLSDTNTRADGLERLKGLVNLRVLDLTHTAIDDKGLVHLHGLVNLESLRLDDTAVSDKGLEAVGEFDVGDPGLQELAGLKRLERLDLASGNYTPVGILKLELALPKLKVNATQYERVRGGIQ
jgi:Leucine rich repeat/Leucine Rich repeat